MHIQAHVRFLRDFSFLEFYARASLEEEKHFLLQSFENKNYEIAERVRKINSARKYFSFRVIRHSSNVWNDLSVT
jgi:hypothetical protein